MDIGLSLLTPEKSQAHLEKLVTLQSKVCYAMLKGSELLCGPQGNRWI